MDTKNSTATIKVSGRSFDGLRYGGKSRHIYVNR